MIPILCSNCKVKPSHGALLCFDCYLKLFSTQDPTISVEIVDPDPPKQFNSDLWEAVCRSVIENGSHEFTHELLHQLHSTEPLKSLCSRQGFLIKDNPQDQTTTIYIPKRQKGE